MRSGGWRCRFYQLDFPEGFPHCSYFSGELTSDIKSDHKHSLLVTGDMYFDTDYQAERLIMNWHIVPCAGYIAPDAAVLLLDSWVLKAWCWVSEPEHWCLLGWPFCLLSSCVVDGSPVSRDEKWCCCLSPSLSSCHLLLHLHPSPTHPPTPPLCPCMSSLLFFLLIILTLSISFSLFLHLSLSLPSLQSSHFQPKG